MWVGRGVIGSSQGLGSTYIIQPLVSGDSHLCAQGLRENQHIARNCIVWPGKDATMRCTPCSTCQAPMPPATPPNPVLQAGSLCIAPGPTCSLFQSCGQQRSSLWSVPRLPPTTHMMNSLGWQTTVATPPTMIQGFITV